MIGNSKILLIDDEPGIRSALTLALTKDGHEVTAVADGRRGSDLLAQRQFDLVITDIIMPECDGMETLSGIHRNHPQLPAIAISGGGRFDVAAYRRMAELMGARKFLVKPFPMDALLQAVRDVLTAPAGDPHQD